MELKNKLLTFRAMRDLTQQEFAESVGVGREVIIRAEQGKSIRPVVERKIELYIENNK